MEGKNGGVKTDVRKCSHTGNTEQILKTPCLPCGCLRTKKYSKKYKIPQESHAGKKKKRLDFWCGVEERLSPRFHTIVTVYQTALWDRSRWDNSPWAGLFSYATSCLLFKPYPHVRTSKLFFRGSWPRFLLLPYITALNPFLLGVFYLYLII